jgi:hypothetical protein
MAAQLGVEINPVYMSYDSLVQRARNDLVRLALEEQYDDLIFMDSDQEWDPAWIFRLLGYEEAVIGGTVVKKSDRVMFNVKAPRSGLKLTANGLMEVDSIGTGFLRIRRDALEAVWNMSEEYINEGKRCRMVFDVKLIDGELVSEDNVFCAKWRSLGNSVWIDPTMTCGHVGVKKYTGNFMQFLNQHKLLTI